MWNFIGINAAEEKLIEGGRRATAMKIYP